MKGDQMGILAAYPTPRELPLSNRTRFKFTKRWRRAIALARIAADYTDRQCATASDDNPADRVQAYTRINAVGSSRALDPVQAMARVKRSPKRTANWALAMHHLRAGMVHSFSNRFKTENSSFRAASPVPGPGPRIGAWRSEPRWHWSCTTA